MQKFDVVQVLLKALNEFSNGVELGEWTNDCSDPLKAEVTIENS